MLHDRKCYMWILNTEEVISSDNGLYPRRAQQNNKIGAGCHRLIADDLRPIIPYRAFARRGISWGGRFESCPSLVSKNAAIFKNDSENIIIWAG